MRVLRTDDGGKYDTVSVDFFCNQSGMKRQTNEASTPQSNGKAERINRNLFNMVRCMLFEFNIPLIH